MSRVSLHGCLMLGLIFALAACDVDPVPTPTPTLALEPSPTIDIHPPTPDPFGGLGANNPTAAALPAEAELIPGATLPAENRPVLLTITAPDGTIFNGELYAPPGDTSTTAPAVLILATRLEEWEGFPSRLRDAGFVALLVKIRAPMLTGDFRALMDTLSIQPEVNPAAIGVMGAVATADAALIGCAGDARCVTAVLLTPQQEAPLVEAMRGGFNPRAILLSASQTDVGSLAVAEAVRRAATGEAVLQPFEGEWRGTQILTLRPDMNTFIIDWLRRHLVELMGDS